MKQEDEQEKARADVAGLYEIDRHCTTAMGAYTKAIKSCAAHGLLPELDAAKGALCALHAKVREKYEAMQ